MNSIKILSAVIICAGYFAYASAQPPSPCPSPKWKDMSDTQRRDEAGKAFKRAKISDDCFARMVSSLHSADRKILEDSLSVIFSSRSGKGKFSQELLFSLYRTNSVVSNKQLWKKIVTIWESASAQASFVVRASHSEGGKIPIADTLYRIFDAAGLVDPQEIIRYARVKCLLGDYRAAADIYCRVIASDIGMDHAAVTQMGQFFADADSSDKAAALDVFEKCVFDLPDIDTVYFRNWLADFYGRNGLYGKEIKILAERDLRGAPPEHSTQNASSGRKLAAAAAGHNAARRYRHAASAAAAAHAKLEKRDQPPNALIAYRAYAQLGIKDSALMWLIRSEASDNNALIHIAALRQETGRLREAESLIDSLPASLSKDTLIVRQHMFSGELGKALNHISSRQAAWRMNAAERMFWQARALIFSGRPHDAAPVLDSIRFAPAWHGTSETLRYKYWTQKLEDDSHAQNIWGRLEFLIYVGDLSSAAQFFKRAKLTGEPGEMTAVRLARGLAAAGRFQEALDILESVSGNDKGVPDYGIKGIPGNDDKSNKSKKDRHTPEFLYFKAEMLNAAARREDAGVLAKKILKDFPGDVFAQKARILLGKINND